MSGRGVKKEVPGGVRAGCAGLLEGHPYTGPMIHKRLGQESQTERQQAKVLGKLRRTAKILRIMQDSSEDLKGEYITKAMQARASLWSAIMNVFGFIMSAASIISALAKPTWWLLLPILVAS